MVIRLSSRLLRNVTRISQNALSEGSTGLYRRAEAIRLLGNQLAVAEVAQWLNLTSKTIRRYRIDFLLRGAGSLRPSKKGSRGRPKKLSKEQMNELKKSISKSPVSFGFPSGRWTSAMIGELIYRLYGVTYAVKYLPVILKFLGYSWQKAASKNYRQDQDAIDTWKTKRWPRILKKAKRMKAKIYFADESRFSLDTGLTSTWAKRGKTPIIKTSGSREGINIIGAIEYFSGRILATKVDGPLNGDSYTDFLSYVKKKTRSHIIWIHDGASYHRGSEVRDFLEGFNRIEMVLLPPYCPELNPIERIWKKIKQNGTHNRFFGNKEELQAILVEMIQSFERNPKMVLDVIPGR